MSSPTDAAGAHTCPAGHISAVDDYCDTCGLPMDAGPTAVPALSAPMTCAACGAPGGRRFCEECGHDAALPPSPHGSGPTARPSRRIDPGRDASPVATVWAAVVRADRAWFDEVRRREGPDAATVEFPQYCPERRFVLTGTRVAIGRHSHPHGTDPEIDLSGPPLDPGVSAQHALLLVRPDGGWEVVDLGSTNGTSIGDSSEPIAPHTPVVLDDGARLRLGAWTTITVGVAE